VSTTAQSPASSLPVHLTGFVGREQELATLRRLIAVSRLLTLTGAGGSGKTRLALETVAGLRDAGGTEVAWVELASLGDPGSLASHLALALGVRAEGGGSAEQALVALLRDHPLLLVLDNCEHLVDECARLVEVLIRACPQLRVLATSREALGIGGERSWLVPALSLPQDRERLTPQEAVAAESVRLFVDRARDVAPSFELTPANVAAVARICRRVDGLPLAVELAAARAGVLTPEQIAERLDDRFALLTSNSRSALPRHRTLRAAVDWSYALLSEAERLLLERLSVFAGGFTLDAAEQVCAGGPIPASEVLDLLASLTTRSLVVMQEADGRARYRLLETIREYAAARRREHAEDTYTSERHADYFLRRARDFEPELILGRPKYLHQVDVEHDDLRAALGWSAQRRKGAHHGLPLCWALMWYWFHRQLWREGFRHFESALATATDPRPELRAAALHGLGCFGLYAGDPRSRERLAEADGLWRAAGNGRWLAFTLLVRTVEASLRRDLVEARRFADEAVAVARGLGEPWDAALVVAHALVPVLVWEGEWTQAERHLVESECVYRACDYAIGVAYVLDARAFIALQLGDPDRAVALVRASLREDPQTQNRWLAGRSLRLLGAAAFARGDLERAAWLYGAAEGMYQAIGARSLAAERDAVNGLPERLRAAMPAERFAACWSAGREASFEAAIARALQGGDADAVPTAHADCPAPSAALVLPAATGDTTAAKVRPTALTVNALGRLEILRDGGPLPAEAWTYARPRELLLYLLSHPEGRSREQIGADLWPEASAAQVKNNFHVTLHHLRKALGRGDLVRYEQDRYGLDWSSGVDFDAARFEHGASEALRRLRKLDSGEAVDAVAAATVRALADTLSCYRGPFLEGEKVGDWHLAMRERLARLHGDALHALAAHHEKRGEHAAAAEAWQRLLAADPLHEDAVGRLMLALERDGRRGEALRVYERFERELAAELDAAPDHAMVRLANKIRRGS
jgi:predicted ATPase/DNA-binding SARP family transcriptional activator